MQLSALCVVSILAQVGANEIQTHYGTTMMRCDLRCSVSSGTKLITRLACFDAHSFWSLGHQSLFPQSVMRGESGGGKELRWSCMNVTR